VRALNHAEHFFAAEIFEAEISGDGEGPAGCGGGFNAVHPEEAHPAAQFAPAHAVPLLYMVDKAVGAEGAGREVVAAGGVIFDGDGLAAAAFFQDVQDGQHVFRAG